MIDVPMDLLCASSSTLEAPLVEEGGVDPQGWFVLPRPEGSRVLLISSNSNTIARRENGTTLENFQSYLPNGSYETTARSDSYCILDAIYHAENQTYYVLDMMCWKGNLFYDCSTEFRMFWLRNKLAEDCIDSMKQVPSSSTSCRNIVPLPIFDCNELNLMAAYANDFGFVKDGLLFYNKAARYVLEINPLVRRTNNIFMPLYILYPTIILSIYSCFIHCILFVGTFMER